MKISIPILFSIASIALLTSCDDGTFKSKEMPDAVQGLSKSTSDALYSHVNWINGYDPVDGGNTVTDDIVEIEGWAFDPKSNSLASSVYLSVGGKIYTTEYGIARDDVAKYFNNPNFLKSGYKARIKRSALGSGNKRIEIIVVSADKATYFQNPTDKPLSVNL